MRTVAFFGARGGMERAFLVYHLAWMLADGGHDVVAADLDPQAHLTGLFVDEESLERLWEGGDRSTVCGALEPLLEGRVDLAAPRTERPYPGLDLVVGDLRLATIEGDMARLWSACPNDEPGALRLVSGLWRLFRLAAAEAQAELVLVDVGPGLGPLNRAALVAADYVVVPLAPDPYSLRGLGDLGSALRDWRREWAERRDHDPAELPMGEMRPIGYVVMLHAIRPDRPVWAYRRWMARIPGAYAEAVGERSPREDRTIHGDPDCLAVLEPFRILMPMALDARKPMFALKPGDGAYGDHTTLVRDCYRDFRALADTILRRTQTA